MPTASDILRQSAQTIDDRAAERDQPGGERSMARTVAAFNALSGHTLSERDGWLFMVTLKQARACATPAGKSDDYVDMSAYAALAGECVAPAAPEFAPGTLVLEGKTVEVPKWARWAAQDADGEWVAYEERPVAVLQRLGERYWQEPSDEGRFASLRVEGAPNPNWHDTLIEIKAKP